jgi:hypothetical protein
VTDDEDEETMIHFMMMSAFTQRRERLAPLAFEVLE